eukprot:3655160-Pyramimonas_sp.AAC.1
MFRSRVAASEGERELNENEKHCVGRALPLMTTRSNSILPRLGFVLQCPFFIHAPRADHI